ncbi:hypothetical protein SRHO_G00224260 [Serrasalmus rhombeus]
MLCLPVVCDDIADVTQAPLVTMPPSSQTTAVHKWPIDAVSKQPDNLTYSCQRVSSASEEQLIRNSREKVRKCCG